MADATLVFVAGASPQVITETVYRLAAESTAIADVYVLTTATGHDLLGRALLGRGGQWPRLLREYPRAQRVRLQAEQIAVLCDAAGRPLADVRSSADNFAAADRIVRFVAERTRDGAPPVHASIAGGRKTMGYLLAAAMMLYGRRQDRLSHVLVHPPELEGTDFYFPPRRAAGMLSYRRPDGSVVRVRASDVGVDLADLPFPRLRAVWPVEARERTFTALVGELQGALDALAQPRLAILPEQRQILCRDRAVRLRPVQLAIYELLAERRKAGCGRAQCAGCPQCFVRAEELGDTFRQQLRERLRTRQSHGVGPSWNEADFRPERSNINKAIARVLHAASWYYQIQRAGERGAWMYGLRLDPAAIGVEAGRRQD
ncbi:MAG: CRISPR-associated ring nuclease Csm6 [Candidatus Binatia bacterium]